MDNKFDPSKRDEYYQRLTHNLKWSIKLGDQLIFIASVLFQIFLVFISVKTKDIKNPSQIYNIAINDTSIELLSTEHKDSYENMEISKELIVFNQIE